MALDPVPWFIGGGAEHSPEVARLLAYAGTSGSEGVIAPTDLRATALPTPGAAVRVYPGGAAILNRYPGAGSQTYIARSASVTDVAIPATGSGGGATRYVILRVDDPQYGGQAPANVVSGPYVRYDVVNSITNLAYPFIPIARVTQPANTAAISGSMITDIRRVANPRSPERTMKVNPVTTAMNLTSTAWVDFPGVTENFPVPSWATYAVVTAQISGMQQMSGAATAELLLQAREGVIGQVTAVDNPAPSSGYARVPSVFIKWENPVSDLAASGGSLAVKIRGRKLGGAGNLRADSYTQLVYDVQFTQEPV